MNAVFDAMLRFGYSTDLHEHLKGLDTECNDYGSTSIYQSVFWTILILSFVVLVNYYRGLFHRPKFTSKLFWFFNVLTVCIVIFILSYFKSSADLQSGNICSDLRFTESDCILFALTASVYALIFCLILSFVLKYFSVHHKRIPI